MKWLVLSWALTLGYLPMQKDMIYTGKTTAQIIAPENALATSMYFEAQAFDCFKAWTAMRSYEEFSYEQVYMTPWRIDFSVGAELFCGPFAIGVWHECDHGVDSNASYLAPYYARGTIEIYIPIRGKYEL